MAGRAAGGRAALSLIKGHARVDVKNRIIDFFNNYYTIQLKRTVYTGRYDKIIFDIFTLIPLE